MHQTLKLMPKLSGISPNLTIRQIVTAWPSCAPILERFAGARWDGQWSLQELGAFAEDAGVDQAQLGRELAGAAGAMFNDAPPRSSEPSPIPLVFAAIALGITVGAGWGVGLLLRIAFDADYAAAPGASVHVHGVAQLWGWMSLFILAVATHLLRQNSKWPAPAWLSHLAAAGIAAGVALFFAGLFPAVRMAVPYVDVIGTSLLSVAAASFGVSAVWSLWGRGQRPQLWHGFLFAMVGWLWMWAGADLVLRLRHRDLALLPDAARSLLILLPVLGFATNAIYGFGIRLIPGLLNISPLRPRCFAATMVLHNLGLCLLLLPHSALRVVGAGMMLTGSLAYIVGLNGLRSKPSRAIYGVDTRGHVLIRVAFFWLVVGLAMIGIGEVFPALPHAYSGAWRHALTVGFITTMILGIAQRIVPVFIRQPLASTRLMLVGAALIIVGNAGRVGLELATIGGWPWSFRLMGLTGLLELTALILFGLNLLLTALARRRIYTRDQPLTADTRVCEAVNAHPELQRRIRELGITMFDQAPFIAPSLTIGALALGWGRQPEQLLAELNVQDARPTTPAPAFAAAR